jgi:photosystem II stability/assembly factor-like uncharacterized protein
MIACLSPNGQNVCTGDGPVTRVLVATLRGVHVLERTATASWTDRGRTLDGRHCSSLMIEPRAGGVFAGMHDGGIVFSGDGGLTWESRANGLTIEHVFSLAYAQRPEGTVLYAGTQPVGLFRSDDYGRSWHELPAIGQMPGREKWSFPPPPHEAHTKTLTFDPRDSNVMYAAVEQGALLKSHDGGRSWRELDGYARPDDAIYRDIHLVVPIPSNPDELFMSGGMGLYHSTDAGETWEHLLDRSFRIGYPDHVIVSPLDDRTLFLSGAASDPSTWRQSHTAHGTVMRSPDRGRTWEPAGEGLDGGGRPNIEALSVAAYPGGFTLFAGNTDGEIFFSDDGARRWSRAAAATAPVSKVGHYRNLQLSA